uniref:SCP domain-containing protein n=1 Tax=Strongyloides venezuelensis TaxID=75913 RepID=A0A0K0G214_STRVS
MFFNFLLFHIIFIISLLRVDVLLGQQQDETQSGETEGKPVNPRNPRNRFQGRFPTRNKKIRFGGKEVREFDKNEAPKKIRNKKKIQIRNPFKRSPKSQKNNKLNIKDYLRRLTLSGKIWHHVWHKCKRIECYSQNNFAPLYGKFLDEMNLYRKIHRSRPLELDRILSEAAMRDAKRSAVNGKIMSSANPSFGENSIICSVLSAPFTVYNWYRERLKHNYRTFCPLSQSLEFTNLVWKGTRKVGIGIVRKGKLLYIFFKFWPESNQNFKFRENVLKPKYHWYNSRNFFKS